MCGRRLRPDAPETRRPGLSDPEADKRIDLHVHTTASDGTLSPAQCVEEAARAGLAAIAITDHDTLAGNAEAQARGDELGLEVVPAVEVSAAHGPYIVHVLGYYPDPASEGLAAVLAKLQAERRRRTPRILERLAQLGCPVSAADVDAEAGVGVGVGRPHIAAVMVRKGYVGSAHEAFDRYLATGAPAYVRRAKPSAEQAIAALRAARAVPVLAHPGGIEDAGVDDVETLVSQLAEAGLEGVEVYYHSHSPGQTAAFARMAARHGLLETGGSDFHGAAKPDIRLGVGRGNLRVPYRVLARVKERRERL